MDGSISGAPKASKVDNRVRVAESDTLGFQPPVRADNRWDTNWSLNDEFDLKFAAGGEFIPHLRAPHRRTTMVKQMRPMGRFCRLANEGGR